MKELPSDFQELNRLSQEIEIKKQLELKKSLQSNDPQEIIKAHSYIANLDKQTDPGIKSYIFDPFSFSNSLGYKDRPISLTYDTLRQMSRVYVVRSVIDTRKDQIAKFADFTDDEQKEGWTIRKKRKPFMTEEDLKMSKSDIKEAKDIAQFILDAGTRTNKWKRDNFESFLRKTIHDSLVVDQMTYEVVRTRRGNSEVVRGNTGIGNIVEFFATDAATYRLADSSTQYKNQEIKGGKVNGFFPSYVQIYQNQIVAEFYPWELCFGIRNQQTSIRANGYGISELEDLIKIITWILNSDQYNGNFFCISPDSQIVTSLGIKKVKDLVNKDFKIYNGISWENAKAYKTGEKKLSITKLKNGLICRTSPDHRFLVIDNNFTNEPVWKKQNELERGDFCLVSSNEYEYDLNYEDFYLNKKYVREFTNPTKEVVCEKPNIFIPTKELIEDVEFWEMLGFGFLDGHFSEYNWQIFPHYKNDKFLFEKFGKICKKYGLNYKYKDICKKVKRLDGNYGYPEIAIYHATFLDWLYELGFNKSENGKIIPDIIFSLPVKYRSAFLRGMFSADGHTQKNVYGYKTPSIAKQNDVIRESIILLLYSLGISCNERVHRNNNIEYHEVWISNIDLFNSKIGYLQDYKNEGISRHKKTKNKWDLIPKNVTIYLAKLIKEEGKKLIKKSDRDVLNDILRGERRLSRNKAIQYLNEASIDIPEWLNYQFVEVSELIETGQIELMYDIEVFDDKHLFFSNFIGVHNSQGSNPKGILKVAGNVGQPMLEQFKQAWYNQIVGTSNAWRIPVIQSEKMEWVDLQKNNTDMQFHLFNEYLRLIVCALYKMDPVEIGFGNQGERKSLFQNNKNAELNHSREKGLEPLLKFWQHNFNKMTVSEITDKYEFAFTGISQEDEKEILEADIKKVGSFEQLNEVRKRRGLSSMKDGDIILNPQYLQAKQMAQMGSPESNAAVDEYTGDDEGNAYAGESDNPFENIERSVRDKINNYTEELLKASNEVMV